MASSRVYVDVAHDMTDIALIQRAYAAVRRADDRSLRRLIEDMHVDVNAPCGNDGETFLMVAAGHGSESTLRLLLDLGARIEGQDSWDVTALSVAAARANQISSGCCYCEEPQ